MRKLLLPVLCVVLGLSTGHSQTYSSGDWSYILSGANEATITAYRGPGGAVAIPESIDGYPVKTVGANWTSVFSNYSPDLSVVTSVTIPDSVTSITDRAFFDCKTLTSITIGSGVTSIGQYAFSFTEPWGSPPALTSINVAAANPSYSSIDGVLFDKPAQNLSVYPAGRSGAYAIPNGVNSIGDGAFNYCSALTSVTIPDSVTSIGNGAFYDCSSLTGVSIPDSVTSIGDGAFSYCTSVTSVTIGSGVTSIGNGTFYDCSSLTSVSIPDSVTSIGDGAFGLCTSLVSVTIPDSVTSIGDTAFAYCTSLASVFFSGNAPANNGDIFYGISPTGTVYYAVGTEAWGATFGGWLTQAWSGDADADTDGDGLKDIAEALMSALGFNWEITQPDLVRALYSNANHAKLYSEMQYNANRTNGQTDVTTNPSAFNLFTAQQCGANFDNGVSAGMGIILSNPAAYNLYTSDSIMDLRMGGLMLQKQGSNAVVTFQPQTTTDLTQPFTNNGTAITNEIAMPGNKGFIRVRANPTPVSPQQ